MQTFSENILLGITHITDLEGYDHMLFLLALCAPFRLADRIKIFWLATAFTLGHSLTLVLSASGVVAVSSDLIEKLIPVTIMLTALGNLFLRGNENKPLSIWRYSITAGFGLIHGLGFSTYFKMMYDETTSRVASLFAFNLGVEVGQLIIIAVILTTLFFIGRLNKTVFSYWNMVVSTMAFLVAAYLLWEKF